MSRQSKNATRKQAAKAITALHLAGKRGPKQTTPKHGKNPGRRLYSTTSRGQSNTRSWA